MLHPHNGIIFGHKKEQNFAPCCNMGKLCIWNVNEKKLVTKAIGLSFYLWAMPKTGKSAGGAHLGSSSGLVGLGG